MVSERGIYAGYRRILKSAYDKLLSFSVFWELVLGQKGPTMIVYV